MSQAYQWLGNDLFETADLAKKHFGMSYGAKHFLCETQLESDLPLRPTWQATVQGHYLLCIEVNSSLSTRKFSDLVTRCVTGGHPVRLWVVLPHGSGMPPQHEWKEARDNGIGVAQVDDKGEALLEFCKPVALSLFGLRRPDLGRIPRMRRAIITQAVDSFLQGSPERGCQELGQELELLTRKFAEYTLTQSWWKNVPKKPPNLATGAWGPLLERLNDEIKQNDVQAKCPLFKKAHIGGAAARALFRNQVSHAPKNTRERKRRDERLRTEFESTLDQLVEWYEIMKGLKLLGKL